MEELMDDMTDETVDHNPFEENHFLPQFRTTVHVHVDTASSDCDGPLYRSYVMLPEKDESSAEFFARFMQIAVIYNGSPDVSCSEEGEWTVRFSHPTEEGYHAEEYRSCAYEECRDERAWQRDVYAERMGY